MKKMMSIVITLLIVPPIALAASYLYVYLYVWSGYICSDHYGDGMSGFDKMNCDTALLLNPFDDYIRDIRVRALKSNHEYEKASQDYSWFILEGSLFSKVSFEKIASRYMERAIVRYMLGDKSGANKDYHLALSMNPEAEKTIVFSGEKSYSSGEDNAAFWNYIHNTNVSIFDFIDYSYSSPNTKDVCRDIEDKNRKKECLTFVNYLNKIQNSKKSK